MEVIWTGLGSLMRGDLKLSGFTYIWMLPIYGLAVFLEDIHDRLRMIPVLFRGGVYAFLILLTEYCTGMLLKFLIGVCPWDYGNVPLSINGVIRLDYFFVWFCVGLIFEKLHDAINRITITI